MRNPDLPSFQRYQLAFTAHLRDPLGQPRPEGVVASRMAVYEEIVFNNLFESVSACFPVARQVLGKRAWLKLTKDFLREHSATSPIFRRIPEEFLTFLEDVRTDIQQPLPPYLNHLCHYEWIELLVATMAVPEINNDKIDASGDLLAHQPIFTPTMQLLQYDYAVHRISQRNKPKQEASTQLLVYRNDADDVKFLELNSVTYRLVALLQQETITGKQALTLIANELNHLNPESVIQFGQATLEDLRNQGVILGSLINEDLD